MKNRRIIIAYIAVFIVCMCIPHALFLVCENYIDTNNYENRELAIFPNPSEVDYKDYASEFEAFYNDNIPFRNQLIELRNRVAYYVFHTSLSDQVLIGQDGWLFLTDKLEGNTIADYTGEHVLSEEELVAIVDNLQKCKKILNEQGIEFVVMISPNKARVYEEYLPKNIGEESSVYAVNQIVNYINDNTDIRVIYNCNDMIDAKEKISEGTILYHKADTHWNGVGAYIGAKSLVEELGLSLPDITDKSIAIEEVENQEADLAKMLHMTNDFVHNESDYIVNNYTENTVTTIQNDFTNVIEYSSDATDDRRVYIVRDSYATAMGEYVGSCFASTYMRHYDSYSYRDLESYNPDVFVLECVERTVPYRFSSFDLLK